MHGTNTGAKGNLTTISLTVLGNNFAAASPANWLMNSSLLLPHATWGWSAVRSLVCPPSSACFTCPLNILLREPSQSQASLHMGPVQPLQILSLPSALLNRITTVLSWGKIHSHRARTGSVRAAACRYFTWAVIDLHPPMHVLTNLVLCVLPLIKTPALAMFSHMVCYNLLPV